MRLNWSKNEVCHSQRLLLLLYLEKISFSLFFEKKDTKQIFNSAILSLNGSWW